jgi:[acyl-carrier-protein] S-malonyltransferase/trans-AT polyketide synthase/acyltransferase/oxidoreductase domain-containing protein
MAADFAERFAESRRAFEVASEAVGIDLKEICAGDDPRLALTAYTQPCLLAAEIAMLAALREHYGFRPDRFGGHSLGEYTALVAAGAIPLESAARLVRTRGMLMQEAVPVGEGGMMAVLQPGLDRDEVERAAAESDVDVANLNSPSQLVLSGATANLEAARARLEPSLAARGGRLVPLEVSAPFHSRLMRTIEPEFRRALAEECPRFVPERARAVSSNLRGGFHGDTVDELVDALARQVSGAVRWMDNMAVLADGADAIYEVGPNKPLSRFFKEIGREVTGILSVRNLDRLRAVAA